MEIYWQQIQGNVAGLAVASALTRGEIETTYVDNISSILESRINDKKGNFWSSYDRAQSRLNFILSDNPQRCS